MPWWGWLIAGLVVFVVLVRVVVGVFLARRVERMQDKIIAEWDDWPYGQHHRP